MGRLPLVYVLCFAIALLGVCGTHAHVEDVSHHSGVHDAAYLVTLIDADHSADHDDDGAIDIDPVVKAFGKFVVQAPVLLLALCCGLLPYVAREIWWTRVRRPLLRPPKHRSRFHVLPPSHAPPTLLV